MHTLTKIQSGSKAFMLNKLVSPKKMMVTSLSQSRTMLSILLIKVLTTILITCSIPTGLPLGTVTPSEIKVKQKLVVLFAKEQRFRLPQKKTKLFISTLMLAWRDSTLTLIASQQYPAHQHRIGQVLRDNTGVGKKAPPLLNQLTSLQVRQFMLISRLIGLNLT